MTGRKVRRKNILEDKRDEYEAVKEEENERRMNAKQT